MHFQPEHLQPNRSIRICNIEEANFQKFPAEMDFVVKEIAISQIPQSASCPCSSKPEIQKLFIIFKSQKSILIYYLDKNLAWWTFSAKTLL